MLVPSGHGHKPSCKRIHPAQPLLNAHTQAHTQLRSPALLRLSSTHHSKTIPPPPAPLDNTTTTTRHGQAAVSHPGQERPREGTCRVDQQSHGRTRHLHIWGAAQSKQCTRGVWFCVRPQPQQATGTHSREADQFHYCCSAALLRRVQMSGELAAYKALLELFCYGNWSDYQGGLL